MPIKFTFQETAHRFTACAHNHGWLSTHFSRLAFFCVRNWKFSCRPSGPIRWYLFQPKSTNNVQKSHKGAFVEAHSLCVPRMLKWDVKTFLLMIFISIKICSRFTCEVCGHRKTFLLGPPSCMRGHRKQSPLSRLTPSGDIRMWACLARLCMLNDKNHPEWTRSEDNGILRLAVDLMVFIIVVPIFRWSVHW